MSRNCSYAVPDWNPQGATGLISSAFTGAGKLAALGLGDLAIIHTAISDAVNAIAGFLFEPYEVLSRQKPSSLLRFCMRLHQENGEVEHAPAD